MYVLAKHPIKDDIWELIKLGGKNTLTIVVAEFYNYQLGVGVLNFLNNGK